MFINQRKLVFLKLQDSSLHFIHLHICHEDKPRPAVDTALIYLILKDLRD